MSTTGNDKRTGFFIQCLNTMGRWNSSYMDKTLNSDCILYNYR